MIINDFNSDDYIYLKLDRSFGNYRENDILRFSIDELRDNVLCNNFFNYPFCFEFKKKKNLSKNDILPYQVYESVLVKENCGQFIMHISKDDIFILNDKIKELIFSNRPHSFISNKPLSSINKDTINDANEVEINKSAIATLPKNEVQSLDHNYNKILQFTKDDKILFDLKKGDLLDMSNISISLLFTNQYYLRLFGITHILDEEDKLKHFEEDFKYCIPNTNIRCFYLNSNIKVRNIRELISRSPFLNGCIKVNDIDSYDYDENGFIRYFYIIDSKIVETLALNIARRVTLNESIVHYNHYLKMKNLLVEAWNYCRNNKNKFKKAKKQNPNLTELEFMNNDLKQTEETKKIIVKRLLMVLKKIEK